jgi:hypothetical protein
MKNFIFWDIMPCRPLKVNRRFGGTCRLHLSGRTVRQSKKLALSLPAVDLQRTTRSYIPQDRTITTTVKTSNPTFLNHLFERDSVPWLCKRSRRRATLITANMRAACTLIPRHGDGAAAMWVTRHHFPLLFIMFAKSRKWGEETQWCHTDTHCFRAQTALRRRL